MTPTQTPTQTKTRKPTARQLLKRAKQEGKFVAVVVGDIVYGASGTLHVKLLDPKRLILSSGKGAQIILDPKTVQHVSVFEMAS